MWAARLTDSQREALIAVLRAQGELGPALSGALEELEFARWDELPEAELPWDRVADLADRQGIDEADVVWDLCGGMRAPVSSSARALLPAASGTRAPQTG